MGVGDPPPTWYLWFDSMYTLVLSTGLLITSLICIKWLSKHSPSTLTGLFKTISFACCISLFFLITKSSLRPFRTQSAFCFFAGDFCSDAFTTTIACVFWILSYGLVSSSQLDQNKPSLRIVLIGDLCFTVWAFATLVLKTLLLIVTDMHRMNAIAWGGLMVAFPLNTTESWCCYFLFRNSVNSLGKHVAEEIMRRVRNLFIVVVVQTAVTFCLWPLWLTWFLSVYRSDDHALPEPEKRNTISTCIINLAQVAMVVPCVLGVIVRPVYISMR